MQWFVPAGAATVAGDVLARVWELEHQCPL